MNTTTKISIGIALISFLAILQPFYESWIDKKKMEFKKHAYKIILGFLGLTFSIYLSILNSRPPTIPTANSNVKDTIIKIRPDTIIKIENNELPPLLYLTSKGNTYIRMNQQKDTVFYRFLLTNNGNADIYNLKLKLYFLSIDHTNRFISTGPNNFSLSSVVAPRGVTVFLEGFNVIDSFVKSDTAYFYLKGSYTNYTKSITQRIDYVMPCWSGIGDVVQSSEQTKKYVLGLMQMK